MGVIGQAHSIAGLAAAYALPPSALPPRTPNHEYEPPRTPGEGSSAIGLSEQSHQLVCNAGPQSITSFGTTSLQRTNLNNNSFNYTGGQYAKYGKRY